MGFQRRTSYNPKRKIAVFPNSLETSERLAVLLAQVSYGGNPEHKIDPGDFGLKPPSNWNPDKELCDITGVTSIRHAIRLLRAGVERGLISKQERNGWPQNIWSVTDNGYAVEAQLENQEIGSYHGYPMSPDDPFLDHVLKRWDEI